MAANKTVETEADVTAFIGNVADERQRADAATLCDIMARVSGEPPKMWGPSIIGFGSYHYVYESGREGDSLRIGFSPRKGQTVLYGLGIAEADANTMARLGKYKTGKGCLYLKRLADVDIGALEELCRAALSSKPRGC
jgi:Domain of unknown function (DU1801)